MMFQNELKEYVATSGLVNMKEAGDRYERVFLD
jgi:hypothetical protein